MPKKKFQFNPDEDAFEAIFNAIKDDELEKELTDYIKEFRKEREKVKDNPKAEQWLIKNYNATLRLLNNYQNCVQGSNIEDFNAQKSEYFKNTCSASYKDSTWPMLRNMGVGAAIGFAVGGPIGAFVGAAVMAGITIGVSLFREAKERGLKSVIKSLIFDDDSVPEGLFPSDMKKASAKLASALAKSAEKVKQSEKGSAGPEVEMVGTKQESKQEPKQEPKQDPKQDPKQRETQQHTKSLTIPQVTKTGSPELDRPKGDEDVSGLIQELKELAEKKEIKPPVSQKTESSGKQLNEDPKPPNP